MLQTSGVGKLRIFNDYSNLNSGGSAEKNLIKRIMNITSNFFYNVLTVQRRDVLKFPSSPNTCASYTVPSQYISTGVTGDLGLFIGNVPSDPVDYVAKSSPCVLLQSDNRPLWGAVIWNNEKLQTNFDQVGVQKLIYVGLHELTHILGFSASLYA